MYTYEFTFRTNEAGLQGIDQKIRITKETINDTINAFIDWREEKLKGIEITDLVSIERIY